jgi:hypothetical protein
VATSPVTGESPKETVKTIARGMPGVFRCDRGDYARMFILFYMRGCGCIERPAFPAPSTFEGKDFPGKPRAKMRGENAKLCLLLFEIQIE